MQARRMKAADLFAEGVRQADIARRLSVSHQTVSEWHDLWSQGGSEALKGTGPAGRRPKLSAEQLDEIDAVLKQGARAYGYPTDVWTLERVAETIERLTGVRYHPGHVWRILHQRFGWGRSRRAVRPRR
jgi:transposase